VTGRRPGGWPIRRVDPVERAASAARETIASERPPFATNLSPGRSRASCLSWTRRARYDPPALATLDDFLTLDVRVGTIVSAEILKGARLPAFALAVDFGELGVRRASAPISDLYEPGDLVGLQVVGIVNLPVTRVASLDSQVLVLAVDNGKGENVLLMPERPVPDGRKVG
jgi:tRNA-binding protein